jgi:hypothetical protein
MWADVEGESTLYRCHALIVRFNTASFLRLVVVERVSDRPFVRLVDSILFAGVALRSLSLLLIRRIGP